MIEKVIEKHEVVANLLAGGWLHLIAIEAGAVYGRRDHGSWELLDTTDKVAQQRIDHLVHPRFLTDANLTARTLVSHRTDSGKHAIAAFPGSQRIRDTGRAVGCQFGCQLANRVAFRPINNGRECLYIRWFPIKLI